MMDSNGTIASSGYEEGAKQGILSQLKEIGAVLQSKGYESFFLINMEVSAIPLRMLDSHFHRKMDLGGPGQVFPFRMSTLSSWRGERQNHTTCSFQVDYKRDLGVHIKKMEISYRRPNGEVIALKTLKVNSLDDVLNRKLANRSVEVYGTKQNNNMGKSHGI